MHWLVDKAGLMLADSCHWFQPMPVDLRFDVANDHVIRLQIQSHAEQHVHAVLESTYGSHGQNAVHWQLACPKVYVLPTSGHNRQYF